MSIEQGPSFIANENIGAFLVVAVPATSTSIGIRCELADTSTAIPLGIIQDSVSAEGAADVRTSGVGRAICGASVSSGAILTWDTAGKVVETGATSATITARCIGIALTPGSANSVIYVQIAPQYVPNI